MIAVNQQAIRQKRIKILANIAKPMMESMTEDQILKHLRNYVAIQYFGSINTQREYAETALLIAQSSIAFEKDLKTGPILEPSQQTKG